MRQSKICLFLVGEPSDSVRAQHGGFDDWFARLFAKHSVDVELFDGRSGFLPERLADYAGIVTTGSRQSLTEPEPWMEAGVELVRQCYSRNIPYLGVCFGHQTIGAAFGGSVVRNPIGWHVSTRTVETNDAGAHDPLFDGLDRKFSANMSHQDIVLSETLSPMNGIRVLATSGKAAVSALAAGQSIRGVQFHPEFSGAVARSIVEYRHAALAEEARDLGRPEDHPDQLMQTATDAPDAERVFHNFIQHFALAE